MYNFVMTHKNGIRRIILILLGAVVLLALITFLFPDGKQSLLGKLISNFYPQTNVNYNTCYEDSDCVVGIRLGNCCSCPQAVGIDSIGQDDWEIYEEEKVYAR